MTRMRQQAVLASCLLMLGAGTGAAPALAQRSSQVQFSPGNYGAMVSGTITGREYLDYKLTARKGQEMYASLAIADTNGNGSASFNILPPNSTGEAIYLGHSDNDNTALVRLPTTGEYTIRVYLMGNDRDTGKTVGFNLDLSIQ